MEAVERLHLVSLQMADEVPPNGRRRRRPSSAALPAPDFRRRRRGRVGRRLHGIGPVRLRDCDDRDRLAVPPAPHRSVDPVAHLTEPRRKVRKRHNVAIYRRLQSESREVRCALDGDRTSGRGHSQAAKKNTRGPDRATGAPSRAPRHATLRAAALATAIESIEISGGERPRDAAPLPLVGCRATVRHARERPVSANPVAVTGSHGDRHGDRSTRARAVAAMRFARPHDVSRQRHPAAAVRTGAAARRNTSRAASNGIVTTVTSRRRRSTCCRYHSGYVSLSPATNNTAFGGKRLEQLCGHLARHARLGFGSAAHRRPIEQDRHRGHGHAQSGGLAQARGQRHRTHARPNPPSPESKDEKVVAIARFVQRRVRHESPAERCTGLEVQIHRHADRTTNEEQCDGAPRSSIDFAMMSRARDAERRQRRASPRLGRRSGSPSARATARSASPHTRTSLPPAARTEPVEAIGRRRRTVCAPRRTRACRACPGCPG